MIPLREIVLNWVWNVMTHVKRHFQWDGSLIRSFSLCYSLFEGNKLWSNTLEEALSKEDFQRCFLQSCLLCPASEYQVVKEKSQDCTINSSRSAVPRVTLGYFSLFSRNVLEYCSLRVYHPNGCERLWSRLVERVEGRMFSLEGGSFGSNDYEIIEDPVFSMDISPAVGWTYFPQPASVSPSTLPEWTSPFTGKH